MSKRKNSIPRELAALKKMTPGELRSRYADLYGEPSRSGNRQWLLRRCAWRLQSLAEGGLSERAKRRAKQLARDQDIRVIPPKDMKMAPLDHAPHVVAPAHKHIHRNRDDRLPMPGACLTRIYKGHEYQVEVLSNGFVYDGERYQSLSAIAHVITGGHWNGYLFFNIKKPTEKA